MEFNLPVIAPSILAADFSRLGEDIQECMENGITWIHCDIMDGHFVPNISFGPGVVAAARDCTPGALLDVHLMIENPDRFIEDFADAGADLISVHYETCPHLNRTLQLVKSHGCMAGVVINPATPVDAIEEVLNDVDLVLIMSVNPGFGGQKFIESTYRKLERLTLLRKEHKAGFLIEVDGGVGPKNIRKLVEAGTDVLVAGSSIFNAEDLPTRIEELRAKAMTGKKDLI